MDKMNIFQKENVSIKKILLEIHEVFAYLSKKKTTELESIA